MRKRIKPEREFFWKKGKSGNPKGRKPGIKNKATIKRGELYEFILNNAQTLLEKLVEQSDQGCRFSQKMLLDRVIPALKSHEIKVTTTIALDSKILNLAQQTLVSNEIKDEIKAIVLEEDAEYNE